MKGAVQGAATTTARTPVRVEPSKPRAEANVEPTPWSDAPTSNSPDRLNPAASITRLRADTTRGDCS
jgi:hypothetical protein